MVSGAVGYGFQLHPFFKREKERRKTMFVVRYNGQDMTVNLPAGTNPDLIRDEFMVPHYPELAGGIHRVSRNADGQTVIEYFRSAGGKG